MAIMTDTLDMIRATSLPDLSIPSTASYFKANAVQEILPSWRARPRSSSRPEKGGRKMEKERAVEEQYHGPQLR